MSRLEGWLESCGRHPKRGLAAIAALLGVQTSGLWYSTPDTVVYLSIARGIATRHRLAALGNLQLGLPPGYPLLISPAFLFSLANVPGFSPGCRAKARLYSPAVWFFLVWTPQRGVRPSRMPG